MLTVLSEHGKALSVQTISLGELFDFVEGSASTDTQRLIIDGLLRIEVVRTEDDFDSSLAEVARVQIGVVEGVIFSL